MTSARPRVAIVGPRRSDVRKDRLKRAALFVLSAAAPKVRGDVTVVLTGDAKMQQLNGTYRGKNEPTDVLSFSFGAGRNAGEPFGDVVISLETASRQARAYDESLQSELERLLVHGTLHLCGYDHKKRREAARMHRLARRLLANLARDGAATV